MGLLSVPLLWVFFTFRFYHGSFHWVGLLLCLASPWQGPRRGCFSQVKSESWHHRCQASVCSLVLSCHNKDLEWRTLKPSLACHSSWVLDRVIALRSHTDCVIALRQVSVTALFYLDNSRKIHLLGVRACRAKGAKRRAPQCAAGGGGRERALWLFLYVFSPLGLPYANWA